jgi:penicillin-binding protein 1A
MLIEKFYTKFIFWLYALLLVLSFGFISIFSLFIYYSHDLPDYKQLSEYDPPLVTRLYSMHSELMEEYATEKRIYTKYEEIPEIVIKAFLAAEDKNFFSHPGFDLLGIARAALQNLVSSGRPIGASTITQQVVKNFLLTNEQTYSRKIKEAILAYRVTRAYSKEKVLELYLNQMFLGNSSYGVASAALNYFNKELDELTIAESAVLAALPKAPSTIDPVRNPSRAMARRNWVLERMYEENFISKAEFIQAKAEPITLRKRREIEFVQADFYAEAVRQELIQKYGEDAVYNKGLVVKTYLDSKLQELATKALRNGLRAYDKKHGWRGALGNVPYTGKQNWLLLLKEFKAPDNLLEWQLAIVLKLTKEQAQIGLLTGKTATLPVSTMLWARKNLPEQRLGAPIKSTADVLRVGDIIAVSTDDDGKNYKLEQIPEVEGGIVAMEVGSGKVVAMVGGYSFAHSKYNRATQAWRQPGSAFKPFVYLAAFEAGYLPTSIVLDSPISLSQGPDLPLWTPKNYGDNFLGPITLRRSLEKSRNVSTVRLISSIGAEKVAKLAERLHIYEKPPHNFSMALGAFETTMMRLTNAYNMVASGGKKVKPQLISQVFDRRGRILYRDETQKCINCDIEELANNDEKTMPQLVNQTEQLIDPAVNYQFISVLEGAVKRGTGRKALGIGKTIAGKTGTTNDSYDTWFIGFSPNLVIGVYVGFDNPKTLGEKETGATLALPIFVDFAKQAMAEIDEQQFTIPEGIELVAVDANTGYRADEQTNPRDIIMEAFRKTSNDNSNNSEMPHRESEEKMLSTPFDKLIDKEREVRSLINDDLGGVY